MFGDKSKPKKPPRGEFLILGARAAAAWISARCEKYVPLNAGGLDTQQHVMLYLSSKYHGGSQRKVWYLHH